jgi:hypothetical protein
MSFIAYVLVNYMKSSYQIKKGWAAALWLPDRKVRLVDMIELLIVLA